MPTQLSTQRSDAELLIASQLDPLAFVELYDRWAQPLLGFFYRRVHDPEVAADLMAETIASLFEKRDRFRDIGRPGSAWIFTLAARQLSHYRRHELVQARAIERLGWTIPPLDEESVAAIEALIESDAQTDLLERVMRELPNAEREAVQLKVVEELAYGEIADRLSCTVVAARVRVHRGLTRMNRAIESM